jgi:LacI family transcriptional regulator
VSLELQIPRDPGRPVNDETAAGAAGGGNRPGRVTMAKVASAAGVSVPTVSKVLNGRADVAPETRRRVEELLTEFGYARPAARQRPAGLIDLVFTDFSAWSTEIMKGAEAAALANLTRLAVSIVPDEDDEERWLSSLARSRTDGVILVLTELSPEHRRLLQSLHVPTVIIDPVGEPDPATPSIGAANWSGGLAATEHLIGLGHRRIGAIIGWPTVLCRQARLDGYRAALERASIPYDPDIVVYGGFRYEDGLESANHLLDLPDPPTAIFAASDQQALAVYEAARAHRLRLPDDLSIVGFDDVPMAQWASPPLTTLHQPLARMAALAVEMLLDGNPGRFNNRVELATNLVVRSSTAPPPGRG